MKCFFTEDTNLIGETLVGYGVMVTPTMKEKINTTINEVAEAFQIPIPMLYASIRTDTVATPRMIVVWLARNYLNLDMYSSAAIFYKEKTYSYYAVKKIQERIDVDKGFAAIANGIKLKLEGTDND